MAVNDSLIFADRPPRASDAYSPTIPTNRQNTRITSLTNADVRSRPSLKALYDAAERTRQEQANYEFLNAAYRDETPDVEKLLAGAKETLATPPPSSYTAYKHAEAAPADEAAAREQARMEFRAGPVGGTIHALTDNPWVTGATVAGSYIPHPLAQVPARSLLALQAIAGMADPENTLPQKALWATGLIPEIKTIGRALKGVTPPGPRLPEPGMHWTARAPGEIAYRWPSGPGARFTWQGVPPKTPPSTGLGGLGEDLAGGVGVSPSPPPIVPSGGQGAGEPSLQSLIPSERLRALEALDAMDEPSRRSVIGGGVGGQDYRTGKVIRVKDRRPIKRATYVKPKE